MLYQRTLALYTALCLLLGLLAVPGRAELVCRMTGQAMAPIAGSPCCEVGITHSPDGEPRYALKVPGCCDLRQHVGRSNSPVRTVSSPELPVVALLPVPPRMPCPDVREVAHILVERRPAIPRGPPRTAASPRAPPFS